MKLLTATAVGQGGRDNDFAWTIEGELVRFGQVCRKDARDPDGRCGCGRSFSGLSSILATTTAMVRDLPLSEDDVRIAVRGYLDVAGYSMRESDLRAEVSQLIQLASSWPVGAVLERRLDLLNCRSVHVP